MVASRVGSLSAAAALSFGLHFLLDFFHHFESFYPLSVALRQRNYQAAMVVLFVVLAGMALPAAWWLLRQHREVRRFAFYALAMCAVPFEPVGKWRLGWMVLVSVLGLAAMRSEAGRRWVVCALAACLPDSVRYLLPPVKWLHGLFHYQGDLSLGDWVSMLLRGTWRLHGSLQAHDPYYWAGWALETLLEGALVVGAFYLLARKPVLEPAAGQGAGPTSS